MSSTTPADPREYALLQRMRVFEDEVSTESKRKDKTGFVVDCKLPLSVLRVDNARAPKHDRVSEDDLVRIAQVFCNAGLFSANSLALHRAADKLILAESEAERPRRLKRGQLARLEQVAKSANHAEFFERMAEIPNGDRLRKQIRAMLALLIAKYTPDTGTPATDNANTFPEDPDIEEQADTTTHQPTISPAPKKVTASSKAEPRPSSSRRHRIPRALFPAEESEGKGIRSETCMIQADEIRQDDPDRFFAYLVFFKNENLQQATEISRKCKDKNKRELTRKWIRDNMGPIPKFKRSSGFSKQRKFYNWQLRHS